DVALTEGTIIYRNPLFELIQYTPKTEKTYPEPVLIIPAWIMKYYILDLSPANSMVRYLVEQGHTVFMISWKNPDARYREVDFTDYLKEGALKALEAAQEITGHKVHAVGYCIGGTLLAMLAAYLANKKRDSLATITLFAAQTDFIDAGGLMTFIDEAQLTYLEDVMFSQGYLRGDQVSAAFELLQPRELIWHRMMEEYLMGDRAKAFDLMAWDKDATRLPYRMHSQYLRSLYLHNSLAEGEYVVDGHALELSDIDRPMFVVSTEKDHIAPWKSVYKIHHLTETEITFALANKGHNGGIISEPGHEGRAFRLAVRKRGGHTLLPDKWMKQQEARPGSWWVAWHSWLAAHSSAQAAPPPMGGKAYPPLADAPGQYVHEH
ncbi:MAG: alpha/beta fold hydrolase, partial [Pseudomonadota bacterium]|nr:alpha/beta fold hydrolase [Pseudomonadota bacterium]